MNEEPGSSPTRTGVARRGDVELWFDVHGSEGPPVLLLAGAACQAIQWEYEFFSAFLEIGHRVIRMDWRDMGLSTWRSFRDHPYTVDDLANDATVVLDDLGVEEAHVLGFSMGGIVAQAIAARAPERVSSLSLLSPGFYPRLIFEDSPEARRLGDFLGGPKPDPESPEGWLVDQWRTLAGPGFEFDPAEWQSRIAHWVRRGQNLRCPHLKIPGHEARDADPAERARGRSTLLERVTVPTLVLHGENDGMFPLANGTAAADAIPGAELIVLNGRGHELFCDPTGEITHHLVDHLQTSHR
ncbi:MAG: alpha/beta fold hydrolase [Microthrixaceae bacterium]